MRSKFKFPILIGGILLLFTAAANAVLDVTLSESLPISRVKYYWSGDANGPRNAGRIINPNPGISFNLSDANLQAKASAAPPTNKFIFGSDAAYPGSSSISIRVIEGDNVDVVGTRYSALTSFSNPSGAPASGNMAVLYGFINDTSTKPYITQIADSLVKIEVPPQPDIRQVTFYSARPARADGLNVTIGTYAWTITRNGTPLDLSGLTHGTSITLFTPVFTFNTGDVYTATVTYNNLWGVGNTSDPYNYPISAGGTGGGEPVAINLKRTIASGLGINSIAVPNATCNVSETKKSGAPVTVTTTSVANGLQLCQLINEIYGGPVVRTIGTWDEVSQTEKGVVINYSGTSIDAASQTALNTAFGTLQTGRGYQVFLKPDPDADADISFKLQ